MEKFQAKLGDFDLKVILPGLAAPNESEIVEHAISGANGALLQGTGQKAKHYLFTAVFTGDDFDNYFFLLDFLNNELGINEDIIFIHPFHGVIVGQIKSSGERFDRRNKTAEIAFDFVENLLSDEAPSIAESVDVKTVDILEAGLDEAIVNIGTSITDALGNDGDNILSKTVDFAEDVLESFTDIVDTGRAYLRKVDASVRTLEGTLVTVENPLNSIITTFDYGTALPGRITKAIAQTIERFVQAADAVVNSPARLVDSVRTSVNNLQIDLEVDVLPIGGSANKNAELAALTMIKTQLFTIAGHVVSKRLGEIYAEDETLREEVRQNENVISFNDENKLVVDLEAVEDLTSEQDLELSLKSARELIQEGIDLDRNVQAPFDMALALLEHVEKIKLERQKVFIKTVHVETSLHSVLLGDGSPYKIAERVLKLNPDVMNPNKIIGNISLYASG